MIYDDSPRDRTHHTYRRRECDGHKSIHRIFAILALLFVASLALVGGKLYQRHACLDHPAAQACSNLGGFK